MQSPSASGLRIAILVAALAALLPEKVAAQAAPTPTRPPITRPTPTPTPQQEVRIVTGVGPGGGPHVKVFEARSGAELRSFFAFQPGFLGGVHVASGDVNGDGLDDIIVGAGPGAGPHVKVFDGSNGAEIRSFFAFPSSFSGGVQVAGGDVDGDGFADIIVGAGAGGGPHVKVFDAVTGAETRSFFAFQPSFSGGVNVAGGDVNGDGFDDIIVGTGPSGTGAGSPGHVKVFDGQTGVEHTSFFPFGGFPGGVFVAAGDVNGDGRADVITGAGAGGGPHVKVFDAVTGAEVRSFFAFAPTFAGGVTVAGGDVNLDGIADVIVGMGPGGRPKVRVFDGRSGAKLDGFLAYDPDVPTGINVSAAFFLSIE